MRFKLESRKVLDIQDKDAEWRRYYFDNADGPANDIYLGYTVGLWTEYGFDIKDGEEFNKFDKWLLETYDVEDEEEIIIKHWW